MASAVVQPQASRGFRFASSTAMRPPTQSVLNTPRPGVASFATVGGAQESTNTPQPDGEGVASGYVIPEGLLVSETAGLNASFSAAQSAVTTTTPVVSCLDMVGFDGQAPGSMHATLACGDQLGHICVYSASREALDAFSPDAFQTKYSHQAFLPEIDCLKSTRIDEKVKCLCFLPPRCDGVISYLASNERTIKLFRMRDGVVPQRHRSKSVVPLRAFASVHRFQVHTVSLCADQETFLSADDFQVYWWHLEAEDTARAPCLMDVKPPVLSNITELLTSARFHPTHGSLFAVAKTTGNGLVGDLRQPPSRQPRSMAVSVTVLPQYNPVQCGNDDILCSISDIGFASDNHIVTRDYLGLKLWDMRLAREPISRTTLLPGLVPHLDHLYDIDAIFDRFTLACDAESGLVVSGVYDGTVAVWDTKLAVLSANDTAASALLHNEGVGPSMTYYSGSSLEAPENVENGGMHEKPPALPDATVPPAATDSFLSQKVLAVGIAAGGTCFSYALEDAMYSFFRSPAASLP